MGDPVGDLVLETVGLRKEFRGRRGGLRVAVDGLDLAVPAGGVHGFLGPNGSGKTTTIRMLLGLAKASHGTMRVFGQEVPRHLTEVIDRVGAVVEAPKFSPHVSGRRNLTLLASTIGVPRTRVGSAIEAVGLSGRDRDRFRSYSLGMKQRLAIAATLLKEPQLLILDEPTNGLDPAGIREIRDTIRALAEQGVTVLLSSHILAEVQQVCTSVTIIGNGRTLASGGVQDLLDSGGEGYLVSVPHVERAVQVLRAAGLVVAVPDRDRHEVRVETEDPGAISRLLAEAGIWLTGLAPVRRDLESVFLELTAADALGPGVPPDRTGRRGGPGGVG